MACSTFHCSRDRWLHLGCCFLFFRLENFLIEHPMPIELLATQLLRSSMVHGGSRSLYGVSWDINLKSINNQIQTKSYLVTDECIPNVLWWFSYAIVACDLSNLWRLYESVLENSVYWTGSIWYINNYICNLLLNYQKRLYQINLLFSKLSANNIYNYTFLELFPTVVFNGNLNWNSSIN